MFSTRKTQEWEYKKGYQNYGRNSGYIISRTLNFYTNLQVYQLKRVVEM